MMKQELINNGHFVAQIIKDLNRYCRAEPNDIKIAVDLILRKKVINPDIFIGSLFSSLMHVEDESIVKYALLGALDLDKILDKKIILNKDVYSIGGSGKDDIKTFNVSSVSSIVAAAMGVNIFKVGAPGTSNKLGSKNILDSLRVLKINKIENIKREIKNKNFLYMSVDDIVPELFRFYDGTFFYPNVMSYGLLPLVTPVRLAGMIYGISDPRVELSARVLKKFGMRNILVVAGMDEKNKKFIDEISVIGKTKIAYLNKRGIIEKFSFNPKRIGIRYSAYQNILEAKNKEMAKNKILNILKGKSSEIELDFVAVNVGAVLFISGSVSSIEAGYFSAKNFLKSGKSFDYFKNFLL